MRSAPGFLMMVLTALVLVGCGEQAERVRGDDAPRPRAEAVEPTDPDVEILRDDSAELDTGWTAAAWAKLGGRPDAWPKDLVPPLGTERARVLVQDGTGGPTTFLSGRVPDVDPSTLENELADRFSGWKSVDGVDVTDVVGTYERSGLHVQVTVRDDEDGATYGIILSER